MAITTSAKKAHRASLRKRVFNLRRIDAMRDSGKAVRKALATKDAVSAQKLLSAAFQAIDKAAKRGVIKANTASRKKSRLSLSLARLSKSS